MDHSSLVAAKSVDLVVACDGSLYITEIFIEATLITEGLFE